MIKGAFSLVLICCFTVINGHAVAQQDSLEVPGLVLQLRHSTNQGWSDSDYPRTVSPVIVLDGGDEGAPRGQGFRWYMIKDNSNADPASWELPSGVVLGLMHSMHQAQQGITAFGRSANSASFHFQGFVQQRGGDLGAPSGQGFCWYESVEQGHDNWETIRRLPRYTVVGLKHSLNQPHKALMWPSQDPLIAQYGYDPANEYASPPQGFVRMVGGDLGAPAGQGYYWYEKITDSQ